MVLIDTRPMNFIQLFQDHGLLIRIEKGNHIFQGDESAENLFLIQSGMVQISKETESGKELTIRICGKGSIIGESDLFTSQHVYSMTAKALTSIELLMISKDSLEMQLTGQPGLMMEYLKWIQKENLKSQSLLRDLVLHGKKGALFSTLIRLANTFGEEIEENKVLIHYNLTNTEIANLCSTSREMVNRMLNDLKKQNIITFDKGLITILDIAYLKKEICCDNCPTSICRID